MLEMNHWECINEYETQFRKRLGLYEYDYIAIVDNNSDLVVVWSVIDMSEFTLADMDNIVRSYYGSLEDMIKEFNVSMDKLLPLIADCYFDELCRDGLFDVQTKPMTWQEAEAYIKNIINE